MVVENPYIDKKLNTYSFIRTFKKDAVNDELKWHRDHNGRYIEVLEGSGWELQLENQLPRKLLKGDRLFIEKETYHRIKRGTTDLVLKIEEF